MAPNPPDVRSAPAKPWRSSNLRAYAYAPTRPQSPLRGGDLEQGGGGGADAVDEAFERRRLVRRVIGLIVRGVRHPDARQAEHLGEEPVGNRAAEVRQHDG